MEEERAAQGRCPFCGEPGLLKVELTISRKPEPRSGQTRGKRVRGVSRQLCETHAETFYKLLKDPRERGRRAEDKET